MYTKRQKVNIDDTRFIFTTNFSGDPSRDRFGSDKRRVNVVIPTMELVNHLMDLVVKVRQTNPYLPQNCTFSAHPDLHLCRQQVSRDTSSRSSRPNSG